MSGKVVIMLMMTGVLLVAAVTLTLYFLTRQVEAPERGPVPPFAQIEAKRILLTTLPRAG